MGHLGAPPDVYLPCHAAALHSLLPQAIKGYTYDTKPGGMPLPDGHQIFQTWKDRSCGGARGYAI